MHFTETKEETFFKMSTYNSFVNESKYVSYVRVCVCVCAHSLCIKEAFVYKGILK